MVSPLGCPLYGWDAQGSFLTLPKMSTPIRTTLTEQHFQLLRDSGHLVLNRFFFLPFWFEKLTGMEFNMHHLNSLPPDLKEFLWDNFKEQELDSILNKLELGIISASEANFKIKALFQ